MNYGKKSFSIIYQLTCSVIILLTVLLFASFSGKIKKSDTGKTAEGVSYISAQAEKDPQNVEMTIREREKKRDQELAELERQKKQDETKKKHDEMIKNLETDIDKVWGEFHDFVILGDSRAEEFGFYKFVDPSRVLAKKNQTIYNISDSLEEIKLFCPKYVFISFGINDVYTWKTGEAYADALSKQIDKVQQAAPGCRIILSSILPVKDFAIEADSALSIIPEYNKGLKELSKKREDVVYADNDEVAALFMDKYWEKDGVHVKPKFYPYWAKTLIAAAYGNEN